jgi:hypothetical protein
VGLLQQGPGVAQLGPDLAHLGLRLARHGYATGTLDSLTHEEANTRLPNWMRQRARWLKGFLATWLVHMRDPRRLMQDLGPAGFWTVQAVTMGERASVFAQELFRADQYSDYLYFHGLAVQMAEALAEWVHARIRRELGHPDPTAMPLRDVLAQRYRGSRYSFGYPACPNVADSRQQLLWLGADRIGLSMDESDQLHPEQSTTALVALHSQARYFSA